MNEDVPFYDSVTNKFLKIRFLALSSRLKVPSEAGSQAVTLVK